MHAQKSQCHLEFPCIVTFTRSEHPGRLDTRPSAGKNLAALRACARGPPAGHAGLGVFLWAGLTAAAGSDPSSPHQDGVSSESRGRPDLPLPGNPQGCRRSGRPPAVQPVPLASAGRCPCAPSWAARQDASPLLFPGPARCVPVLAPRARGGAGGRALPDRPSRLSLKGVCGRVDAGHPHSPGPAAGTPGQPVRRQHRQHQALVRTTLPSSSGHPWGSSGLQGALAAGLPCPSRGGALAISLGDGACAAPAGCCPARPRRGSRRPGPTEPVGVCDASCPALGLCAFILRPY